MSCADTKYGEKRDRRMNSFWYSDSNTGQREKRKAKEMHSGWYCESLEFSLGFPTALSARGKHCGVSEKRRDAQINRVELLSSDKMQLGSLIKTI